MEGESKMQKELRPICQRFENAIATGNKEEAVEMATRLLMLGVYFEVHPKEQTATYIQEDFETAFKSGHLEKVTELSKEEKKQRQKKLMKMGYSQAIIFKVISQKLKDEKYDEDLALYYVNHEKL